MPKDSSLLDKVGTGQGFGVVDSLGRGGAVLSLPLGPGGRKRFGLQTCPGLGQTNLE